MLKTPNKHQQKKRKNSLSISFAVVFSIFVCYDTEKKIREREKK
jgi:hypothetical protein